LSVASSKIIILFCFNKTLAKWNNCLWPTLKFVPPPVHKWSSFSGQLRTSFISPKHSIFQNHWIHLLDLGSLW
jgi:hypothetical protein